MDEENKLLANVFVPVDEFAEDNFEMVRSRANPTEVEVTMRDGDGKPLLAWITIADLRAFIDALDDDMEYFG